jgi:hypothetical protein
MSETASLETTVITFALVLYIAGPLLAAGFLMIR